MDGEHLDKVVEAHWIAVDVDASVGECRLGSSPSSSRSFNVCTSMLNTASGSATGPSRVVHWASFTRTSKTSLPMRSASVSASPAACSCGTRRGWRPDTRAVRALRRCAAGLNNRSPAADREDHRLERLTSFGQLIHRGPPEAEHRALDEPDRFHVAEPQRQQVGPDAWQSVQEVRIALWPEQEVSDDQEHPAVAQDVEAARHRAVLAVAAAGHRRRTCPHRTCISQDSTIC